ncbi:MAG: inner membrane CreD family protein [Rhodospirillales bacterium]|nr:inner membrane CreD family protein [Rhodospirillales bacterium]
MSPDLPAPAPQTSWRALVFSVLVVAAIVAAPLFLLRGLVAERIELKQSAQAGVAKAWGGRQWITGPALEIPLVSDGHSNARIVVLPQSLDAEADLEVERRSRGLFEALLYGAKITLAGRFVAPDWAALGISPGDLDFSRARLVLGVSDIGGIRGAEQTLDGKRLEFVPLAEPGYALEGLEQPRIALSLAGLERGLSVNITLDLAGTEELSLAPAGDQTTIRIAGNWAHPEFAGAFLPSERKVSEAGFEGRWSISKLARPYPGAWKLTEAGTVSDSVVSVRIIEPVDIYTQTDRLLKYGLMIIALAFAAIGIGAAFLSAMPHPVEWLLAGAAVALAFLLTLALSEHLGFALGYALANTIEVAMVTFYLAGAVTRRLGLGVGAALVLVHGFVYVVLGSERYALLAGSLGLTLALAAAMALTRRIDWNRLAPLGSRRPAPPAA